MDQTWVSHIAGRFFIIWTTREAPEPKVWCGWKGGVMNIKRHIYHSLLLLFSHSVVSDSFPPHGLQHTRLPCPSLSPEVCSNSCPLSQWCHPTISSSIIPFSSCLQSFPVSWSFPMSQLFTSGGQSIGTSALTSVLPVNIQGWFPLGLTGWISLQSKGLWNVFCNTTFNFMAGVTVHSMRSRRMCVHLLCKNTKIATRYWTAVTESKLTLLAAWQASESERGGAEARKMTLVGELADWEDGRLAPQNNHLIGIWIPGSFIDQRERSNEELESKGKIERERQWGKKSEMVFSLPKHLQGNVQPLEGMC